MLLRADAGALPLADSSVDAIITDPPYGLEFMGKQWDKPWANDWARDGDTQPWEARPKGGTGPFEGRSRPRFHAGTAFQAWCEQWAAEALRVLKPGGHLVAFGGTRTYHRLASGIEDAGFEIRDTLDWVYGSGFPKSLDVSKAIDRRRKDNPDWQQVGAWLRAIRLANGMSTKAVCAAIGAHGAVNHGGAVSNWENGFSCPTWDQWVALRSLLGFGDEMDAEVWRLNGRKGSPGEAWLQRPPLEAPPPGMRASWTGGRGWNGNLARGGEAVTPDAESWQGWGTALKPAHEPIVLARKPLAGTVAGNVLEHSTGALNIDGCRVAGPAGNGHWVRNGEMGTRGIYGAGGQAGEDYGRENPSGGRWPPNALFSHGPGCVQTGTRRVRAAGGVVVPQPQFNSPTGHIYGMKTGEGRNGERAESYRGADGTEQVPAWNCADGCPVAELDQQSGANKSSTNKGNGTRPYGYAQDAYTQAMTRDPAAGVYGDQGGASRFFPTFRYQAKASTAERNRGLPEGTRNQHPTVKPVELMRWLVRLVTPPGGLVLDPFCGSGSTGVACALEGFRFIGCDLEAEYLDIARARIGHALTVRAKVSPTLFEVS